MYRITKKERLASEIYLLEFEAQELAAAASAGQFVIIRVDEPGERFPLTLFDWDAQRGTIQVVCQAVGVSTKKLCALDTGEAIIDLVGPLGKATHTTGIGKVICIGGGVGTAEAHPIAKQFATDGNEVSVIIGARSKDLVICEDKMREFCDSVYTVTDDGSYGRKGFVTTLLAELLITDRPDLVFAIGPAIMMKKVAEMTKASGVKTLVSLNSIMIDGTGMCGGCRVVVNGKTKFACVDGPEFDAHQVDFDDMILRGNQYQDMELRALKHYDGTCRLDGKK